MTESLIDIHGLTRSELAELAAGWGADRAEVGRLWRWLYRDLAAAVDASSSDASSSDTPSDGETPATCPSSGLSRRLRERMEKECRVTTPVVAREESSTDHCTRKYLLEWSDGARIETVLMHFRGRHTACLSSQAGCPLGCVFCATGQAGFARQLSAGEIVSQAVFVERRLRSMAGTLDAFARTVGTTIAGSTEEAGNAVKEGNRQVKSPRALLSNLVLMGMGEPLLNYDAVMRALTILGDSGGMAIGAKQTTISTVGVIPGIVRMADESRPYSLAVSLHAATQNERLALVPSAATWPLDEIIEACRYYARRAGRKIFFEWTLIEGQNDSLDHARQLAELVRGIPAQVNLIPLNPTQGFVGDASRDTGARRFQSLLQQAGIPTTLRQRRGIDIAAGCGQLAAPPQRRRASHVSVP